MENYRNQEIYDKIENWTDKLTKHFKEENPNYPFELKYVAAYGKTWIKILKVDPSTNSVFAFVDWEGNIYKPASYKAPAKGIRATLDDAPLDMAQLYRRR